MVYVSPVIELLRARPGLVFWTAALGQALVWVLVPSLFYVSPPGDVPLVLAVGHEWQLGSWFGPPLPFWLAEIAFRLAGRSVAGVYLLSQICIVVTFWAVFALGRSIVGAKHAAIAVLLMAGISYFSVPTPDFGPAVLAMPLVALSLLHFWRALGEGWPRYWLGLGVDLGLLVLATYAGLIMIGLIAGATLATRRGRASLVSPYPWAALALTILVALPHLIWLYGGGAPVIGLVGGSAASDTVVSWLWLIAGVVSAHAGLMVLAIGGGALIAPAGEMPSIEREPVGRFGRAFIYGFALAPALLATLAIALGGEPTREIGAAPFIVLSGLLVVLLAGDGIRIHRQSVVGWIWLALVAGPALLTVIAIVALPFILGTELKISEPGSAMGRFFTESFNRRTGKPLAIVIGNARLGGLVALTSPDRPSLFIDAAPERAPWIREGEVAEKGAIVVWPLTDPTGQPPAAIRARFPDLVPEVPRAFDRTIQGRLPLLRVGWAVVRPANVLPAAPQ
jgi:4-amino-4-deoxy-L-arabinose transferase-like glycosyltransferase